MMLLIFVLAYKLLTVQYVFAFSNYNVFTPSDEYGGFGDLVTNFWMARMLSRTSDKSVRFYYDPSFEDKISKLIPDYNKNNADDREIIFMPNTKFISPKGKDSCNLLFSHVPNNKSKSINTELENIINYSLRNNKMILFSEYNPRQTMKRTGHLLNKYMITGTPYYFYTGINYTGLYVTSNDSDGKQLTKSSKIKDLKEISRVLSSPILAGIPFATSSPLLGIGYSAHSGTVEDYLYMLIKYIRKNHPTSEKKWIFIKRPNTKIEQILFDKMIYAIEFKYPDIILKPFTSMPFEVMDFLFKMATLPVLVTGDMSLTQAIQYEKPFIYETLQHKEILRENLFKALSLDLKPLKQDHTLYKEFINLNDLKVGSFKFLLLSLIRDYIWEKSKAFFRFRKEGQRLNKDQIKMFDFFKLDDDIKIALVPPMVKSGYYKTIYYFLLISKYAEINPQETIAFISDFQIPKRLKKIFYKNNIKLYDGKYKEMLKKADFKNPMNLFKNEIPAIFDETILHELIKQSMGLYRGHNFIYLAGYVMATEQKNNPLIKEFLDDKEINRVIVDFLERTKYLGRSVLSYKEKTPESLEELYKYLVIYPLIKAYPFMINRDKYLSMKLKLKSLKLNNSLVEQIEDICIWSNNKDKSLSEKLKSVNQFRK
jgi:hypothetical protein